MGRPKALLPFAGEPMLCRVVRVLAGVVQPVVVVRAAGQELPPLPFHVECVTDEREGCGPLQGLAAGFKALTGQAEAAYVSSCDVPLLRPAFVQRMIQLLGNHAATVPYHAGRFHPLAAVYRLTVAADVEGMLCQGCLCATGLVDRIAARCVTADELVDVDPRVHSLWNVNTAEQYQAALAELERSACTD